MDFGLERFNQQLERLAKVPRGYRLALLPVIAILVGGVYTWGLYLPKAEQLEGLRGQQLQLQRRLNEVRSVAANVGKFEEEIAALERKLKVALRQLPDSKELPVLLTDVNTLGKNSGLEIKAFRPGPEVKRDFYAEVPIEIEFVGKFHDIATFFDQVSKLPRIVNVSELEIRIDEESAIETVLKVSGEAVTFRFLEEADQAPAAPAPGGAKGGKAGAARGGQAPAAGNAAASQTPARRGQG
jgi:type IV pilus assembly protein PilO